jgi:hypothetical protein
MPGIGFTRSKRIGTRALRSRLEADPEAIIVYNLRADSTGLLEDLGVFPARVFIEIRR